MFCCCCCCFHTVFTFYEQNTGLDECVVEAGVHDYALLVLKKKVIPLDLFFFLRGTSDGINMGNTSVHNRWAFGGIEVGIWWYSGGHLMVLRWGTHSQQVGIWWYSGGHLVVYRWGKHGGYFRKWATPVGPHTTLAPTTTNGPSWARLNVAAQLGPS